MATGIVRPVESATLPDERIVQAWRVAAWDAGVYSIARFQLVEHVGCTHWLWPIDEHRASNNHEPNQRCRQNRPAAQANDAQRRSRPTRGGASGEDPRADLCGKTSSDDPAAVRSAQRGTEVPLELRQTLVELEVS